MAKTTEVVLDTWRHESPEVHIVVAGSTRTRCGRSIALDPLPFHLDKSTISHCVSCEILDAVNNP